MLVGIEISLAKWAESVELRSAGWHAHLDVMQARLAGQAPAPFWDRWGGLKAEYTQRLPA